VGGCSVGPDADAFVEADPVAVAGAVSSTVDVVPAAAASVAVAAAASRGSGREVTGTSASVPWAEASSKSGRRAQSTIIRGVAASPYIDVCVIVGFQEGQGCLRDCSDFQIIR
jgi:hypothetical protein